MRAFSHDGSKLATADYQQQTVSVWDATSGELLREFACGVNVDSVTFSRDDCLVIAGCDEGQIQLWEWKSGTRQAIRHEHESQTVFSMDVSPTQDLLATGGWDGTTVLWQLPTLQKINTLDCNSRVFGVRFSTDGKTLATTRLREARLWSVETGQLITTFRGHTHSVNVPDFSPDGNLLATGGWDGMVKLWDLRTYSEIASLSGHSNGVVFSPNGKYLASAGTSVPHVTIWRANRDGELETGPNTSR